MKKTFLIYLPILFVCYETAQYLANDIYLPALPQMMADLATTTYLAQLTISFWFLGSISMVLWGPLSDRFGRRVILLGGGVLFLITTAICATSHNITALLIARFFQGAAVSSFIIPAYAIIHELFEQTAAIQTLAKMASITVLAPALGPLVGGLLLHWMHWRMLFVLLAVWSLIVLIFLFKWTPETTTQEQRKPIILSALTKSYLAILSNKTYMLHCLAGSILFGIMISWVAAGPFLVMNTYHYSPLIFGIAQAAIFGSYIAGNHFVNNAIRQQQAKNIIAKGIKIVSLATLMCILAALFLSKFFLPFVITLMIFCFGSALVMGPSQRLAIEASQEPMGTRVAVNSCMMGVTAIIGSSVVSLSSYQSTTVALIAMVGVFIILFCRILWLDK